jgi:DNA-directed RNA polymerase subunit M|tara:strand:- start:684 stop:1007 length:324 start_codon:yes stop_codon:yes gene_type:complete
MKFCPTCDARLIKDDTTSILTCPECKYTENGPEEKKQSTVEETESDFLVLDENEGKEVLPTIEIECEKEGCDSKEAVWWMLQTRSADEPTTQFFRCTKCQHTWRNYA